MKSIKANELLAKFIAKNIDNLTETQLKDLVLILQKLNLQIAFVKPNKNN